MAAETGSNEEVVPRFSVDDDLAKEIAPGGRLDRMVALGKDLDITWVVDPDLLASVDAMTGQLRASRDRVKKTTAGGSAGGRQAVARRRAGARWPARRSSRCPFGDPDLASLAHNGTARSPVR
ncbi:hypothetical protein SHIRM173S_04583 [Streptomyces hirsutus]